MSTYVCDECGARGIEERLYCADPFNKRPYGSLDLCETCAVRLWPCNVRFVWHHGIPNEVRAHFETLKMLERLRGWDVPHAFLPIHFFHRRVTEATKWIIEWDRRSQYAKPAEPYGYRGWCAYNEIVVLYDETETLESIEWIFYHELAHAVCNKARLFDTAMERENRIEGREGYEWRDDEGHELDSEERLVNRVATAHMGGKERARPWWRPRVIAFQRGYTVFPDAFAPENSPELEMFRFAVAEGWTARRQDGTMLPIHGYDYGRLKANLNPAAFSDEERRDPGFRDKLLKALNPTTAVATEPPPTAVTEGE